MERRIIYTITSDHENWMIKEFLKEKNYSRKVITLLKERPNDILHNGKTAFVTEKLKEGDSLEICLKELESSENIEPEEGEIAIIYEDEDILVVDKPAGMPIHPSVNHHRGTLANRIAFYYKKQGIPFVFRCMNRLDRDTSGLVVIAKHSLSGAILSKNMKECGFHREYLAVVCGKLPESGIIKAPIGRVPGSVVERMVDPVYGQEAVTHYRRLQYGNDHSLAAVRLETGRTHQIRVHMKHIGCPLPGDFLYHPDFTQISRQALHSHCIWFVHPITEEEMTFRSPLPKDMKQILN